MKTLLYLKTITPLHVGTGQSVGTTDLPIAREKVTNWPVVPGSSVKGVLKEAARVALLESQEGAVRSREKGDQADQELAYLFGSPNNDDASAGALAVTDLRCLLFPVRSYAGTFAYATSPLAIARANEFLAITGTQTIPSPPNPAKERAMVSTASALRHGEKIYLEDLDLTPDRESADSIAKALKDLLGLPQLADRLAILHDDAFTFFTESATEVVTHVSLNFETRTARGGFLRSEERVPAEAVFVGLVTLDRLHYKDKHSDAEAKVRELDGSVLQFGGKGSVGNGLCRVRVV